MRGSPEGPDRMYSDSQMDYMIKAFEVMIKIASELMRDNSGSRNDDLIEFFLNQNFEKEMNKGESYV